jgi:hypothetical protein
MLAIAYIEAFNYVCKKGGSGHPGSAPGKRGSWGRRVGDGMDREGVGGVHKRMEKGLV